MQVEHFFQYKRTGKILETFLALWLLYTLCCTIKSGKLTSLMNTNNAWTNTVSGEEMPFREPLRSEN